MSALSPVPVSDTTPSIILAAMEGMEAQEDNKEALDAAPVTVHSTHSSQSSQNSSEASFAVGEFVLGLLSYAAYFVASEFADLYVATVIAISVTVLTMIGQQTQHQHINRELWIELAAFIVTGGAGFFFQSIFLVKLAPTVCDILMSGALLLSECLGKNGFRKNVNIIKDFSDDVWAKLSRPYAGFLVSLGALNVAIAYTCSNRTWVLFHLFGSLLLRAFFLGFCNWKDAEWKKEQQNAYTTNNNNLSTMQDANALA